MMRGTVAPLFFVLALLVPVSGQAQLLVGEAHDGARSRYPAVAVTDAGFAVTWEEESPSDAIDIRVQARFYDAAGSPLGAILDVSVPDGTFKDLGPHIAVDGLGNVIVVWWRQYFSPSYDSDIYARRYDSSGEPLGPEFLVNDYTTGSQFVPAVAADASGKFVVAWDDVVTNVRPFDGLDGSGTGVFARRFGNDGTPAGPQFQVNTYTTGDQYAASVGMQPTGEFVIAWNSRQQAYGGFAQRFDSGGNPVGSEFQLNTYTTGPRAGLIWMWPSGQFVITGDAATEDGGRAVFAQRFYSDGTPQEAPFQVNTTTSPQFGAISAALRSDGQFVVAWQKKDQYPVKPNRRVRESVFVQRYDAAGAPVGPELPINSWDGARSPFIGMNSTGEFVVAYQRNGIFAQRFTADGVALEPRIITTHKLFMKDPGDSSRRKLVVKSKAGTVDSSPQTGMDLVADGAWFQLYNSNGSGEAACFPLVNNGSAGWSAKGDPAHPTVTYRDPDGVNGPCSKAVLKDGHALKIACQGTFGTIPYTLDEASQGSVAMRFTSGTTTYCSDFSNEFVEGIRTDHAGLFVATNEAPYACPAPPQPCP